MSRQTPEAAFPKNFSPMTGPHSSGMTLRDYFAAKAMQAMIAAHTDPEQNFPEDNEVSKQAYQYADAMLEERNKT